MAAVALSPSALEEMPQAPGRTTSFVENGAVDSIFEVEWAEEADTQEVRDTAKKAHEVLRVFKAKGYPELGMLFDVWKFCIPELYAIVLTIFDDLDLFRVVRIPYVDVLAFIMDVDRAYYAENAYHSFKHAMDVCCQTYYMLTDLQAGLSLTPLDQLALLIAALCHDTGHPGRNNLYQVKAQTDLAKLYGDVSTLEKHSCSIASALIEKHALFRHLDVMDMAYAKLYVDEAIMATDMVFHGPISEEFKATFINPVSPVPTTSESPKIVEEANEDNLDASNPSVHQSKATVEESPTSSSPAEASSPTADHTIDSRLLIGRVVLHAADISNACRPWDLCKRWSDPVVEEFFKQGDTEKAQALPISPNMNRETTTQHQIAIGFGDYIVKPLFKHLNMVWPQFKVYVDQLEVNKLKWERHRDGLPVEDIPEPPPVEQLSSKKKAAEVSESSSDASESEEERETALLAEQMTKSKQYVSASADSTRHRHAPPHHRRASGEDALSNRTNNTFAMRTSQGALPTSPSTSSPSSSPPPQHAVHHPHAHAHHHHHHHHPHEKPLSASHLFSDPSSSGSSAAGSAQATTPIFSVGRRMSFAPGVINTQASLLASMTTSSDQVTSQRLRYSICDVTRFPSNTRKTSASSASSNPGSGPLRSSTSLATSRDSLPAIPPLKPITGSEYKSELENTLNFQPSTSRDTVTGPTGTSSISRFHGLRRGSTPVALALGGGSVTPRHRSSLYGNVSTDVSDPDVHATVNPNRTNVRNTSSHSIPLPHQHSLHLTSTPSFTTTPKANPESPKSNTETPP